MKAFFKTWRFLFVILFFVFAFSILLFRAYQLQLAPENRVAAVAEGQFGRELRTVPRRASILDRNGRSLAMSVNAPSVFIDPYIIKSPSSVAGSLSKVLNLSRSEVEALIRNNKKKRFVWLKRQISEAELKSIQTLDLRGVGLIPEFKRHYILGQTASSVLGFVSHDGRGLSGIEASYNDLLAGEENIVQIKRDARGRPLFEKVSNLAQRQDWKSLYLTIDSDLQFLVEKYLSEALEINGAASGVAIVMNPQNGEVLALADLPNFDPEDVGKSPAANRKIRAVSDPIEPGSVLKIFGVGEAIDRGLVHSRSVIQTPGKVVKISGKVIRESETRHERSRWSVEEAVRFSSNVAMVKLLEMMGPAALENVYEKFGFGDRTGVDLPGESRGIFNRWGPQKKLEWATMSFGQGIALTPMQITTAFAAIANGGRRVRPRLMKEVREGNRVVKSGATAFEPTQNLWSPKTLKEVKALLQSVVQVDASGRYAIVPGYSAAGKTGTSQKVDFIKGGYKPDAYWASFVGFAPAENPKVVVYVMLDEPTKKHYYGGVIAAPVFSKIAQSALRTASVRYDVP